MVSVLHITGDDMHCCEKNEKTNEKSCKDMEGSTVTSNTNSLNLVLGVLAVFMLALLVFNQLALNDLSKKIDVLKLSSSSVQAASASGSNAGSNAQGTSGSGSATTQPQSTTTLTAEQIWSEIKPTGIPAVYGAELGVSYDSPEAGIQILYQFDDYGPNPIKLSSEKLQRYIGITTSISCEYCCGASTIGTSAGTPACGCAHSAAMRGLAKYLLDKHSDMSDEQILEELGKLKVLYFPANSIQKAAALKSNNLPTDYISISSNKYRGLENQVSSSSVQGIATQVGGC